MCDFCEKGKFKEVDGYETGRNMNIASYFSNGTDGIMMDEDGGEIFLVFDNSGGEYGKGAVKIAFCPLCGRKLGEETEKTNLRDKIIEKIKQTEPDYINYSDFYTKYGTLIPGIGDRWHWFENLTDKAKREGLFQISDMSEAELFDLYVQINEDWKKTRSRQFWEMYGEKCELEKRIKSSEKGD